MTKGDSRTKLSGPAFYFALLLVFVSSGHVTQYWFLPAMCILLTSGIISGISGGGGGKSGSGSAIMF